MKLIVGLGNPGNQYSYTRHNMGFLLLDIFREKNNFSQWRYESKFTADISTGILEGKKILLVKPQTFMNLSGESLQKICHFYKISSQDFTIIYDDKDMDFGKIKIREKGSAGGHNGVKNIIKYFGEHWKRIKVGIGKTPEKYETVDWVLSKFLEEELISIDTEIYDEIENMLKKNSDSKKNLPTSGVKKKQRKKLYCIGIGGIGVSALARYYLSQGWSVFGSDANDSMLIGKLKEEGCDIIIGSDDSRIDTNFDRVIYSEAITENHSELQKAHSLDITTRKYNEALADLVNTHRLIAVTGTHGKSTTTSMIAQILKDSGEDFSAVIGTLLKEFDGKNFFTTQNYSHFNEGFSIMDASSEQPNTSYFAIEACEYKEHFLAYTPTVAVITNIEYDHADYFQTQVSYLNAFEKFIENVISGGFVILDAKDTNSQKLVGKRNDISYILVHDDFFEFAGEKIFFPEIQLSLPGEHILFDAKLAYIVGHMIGIDDTIMLKTLKNYSGVWRRMEIVGNTENGNILMSDYAHHPTEIATTLKALQDGYPDKKIFTIFQPHQYSRTLELLEGFKSCFTDTDTLVIPNIYESRDSEADKKKINSAKLVSVIEHQNIYDGKNFEYTQEMIETYDKENPDSSIILLLGAGDIDTLREKIIPR